VLKDRKKDTVAEFLSNIPKRLCFTNKAVCTDMYDGFINAVKEKLPKSVKIIVDRCNKAGVV
jgi:transposase